ncbi:hypothetical protein PMZ80_009351 [Knufia obscura]|uniref:Kinesin motor domain-containing protein n=1 Tax=Knufia obscura TaxID=1635080 RepID=A0ABR0RCM6_9EURO|nr:hypothetical protein PMZ80_009351 [Knufia obscura]
MAASPPATPEATRNVRPQSMFAPNVSPEAVHKSRPQSMMGPPRSRSRMSRASSRGGTTRVSDEEAKTAVKVVVRVRPPLRASDPGYDLIPQRFQRSTVNVPTDTSLSVESPQGRKIFIFDRVFGEDNTQKGIWEYLEESVDSFLQGYNVSILAYGQSGAGKSYTMGTSGPTEQLDPSTRGIIPRAAAHLFTSLDPASFVHSRQNSGLKTPTRYSVGNIGSVLQNMRSNTDKNWQMSVTYVEIYNEQPRDLLLPEGASVSERSAVQIREDAKGRIFVEGLRSVPVSSVEELMGVLNHGSSIRQTDATAINSRSSRSHAVFTINLRQEKPQNASSPPKNKNMSISSEAGIGSESSITVDSKLHFVDLAGSERLKNTGATGDRAREGISINAGLASLGKVISQLSSRSVGGHVSYRDSKLTRMLQDSLGGNAITYMVACVTPAEFHLSETLNTVQYAQRARNIQSKPQIQQINDDGDKQATIERLRTEVAFLRQQIRSAEGGERKPETSRERGHGTDLEIQNQLLDVQEGYRALSERHAKLVAELSQSSREPTDLTAETPAERLKRSQANQQQIEHIILEYEKTIQSLEANLSSTRSSLAMTESSLLERETKCAYIETMNQQLNTRVQKLMDREGTTESYLHELEARLQDSTSGSEKHDNLVAELRREMARVRESEMNAEDYISTLEERLAEAEQDMEIMSREVERLEQLVERQRSLGKLHNLLYELDHVQRGQPREAVNEHEIPSVSASVAQATTPSRSSSANGIHTRKQSEPMEIIQEAKELDFTQSESGSPASKASSQKENITPHASAKAMAVRNPASKDDEPSPAQSKFMQDKFESVSQELFDLRLEHESATNEYDLLSAKYHEALRTLAEMQSNLDEARSHPAETISPEPSRRESFLMEDAEQGTVDAEQRSSSRSLSSELSLVGESATSVEPTASTHTAKETLTPDSSREEIERLQALVAEHEQNINSIREEYTHLHKEHKGTLDTVERLKTEAQRSRSPLPPSPGHSMLRRPSSQLGNSYVDRGYRSIASLRALLADELESKPDYMENAEVHLTAATHELQARMNRIQSLESDLQNVKKEMEMKSTIISGLTRERNSLKSGTPVDLSMVSQMRDQLIQKETELKTLYEGYSKREQELQAEVAAARKEAEALTANYEKAKKDLEDHELRLKTTTAELEAALSSIETLKSQQNTNVEKSAGEGDDVFARAATAKAMGDERENYQGVIDKLKHDLEQQISTNASHTDRIEELTQMHEAASKDIHEHSQIIQEKSQEIEMHKVKIATLNSKIQEAESAVEFHKHGLKSLHEAHRNELEELKLSHAGVLAGYDDQIAELNIKHGKALNAAETDLGAAKSALEEAMKGASAALGHETSVDMLANHISDLAMEKKHHAETNKRLVSTNAELEAQLTGRQNLLELEEAQEAANTKVANYQQTIRNLANEVGNHEETIREKEMLVKKHEEQIQTLQAENQKKIVLIEELEQQLQSSYEQHHNRLSVIQQQGSHALNEAQKRISQLEQEVQRNSVTDTDGTSDQKRRSRPLSPSMDPAQRSNSISSNLRKSASVASLPSPPPAIPLPPLPTIPNLTGTSGNPSPPQSRHTSKEVAAPQTSSPTGATKENASTIKRQSAIIEDQDSRLRTMEKHLHAEKQLTATLEEALVDLETQSNKLRVDAESWKKKAWSLEEEMSTVRKEHRSERLSVQAVEEEVKKRRAAEEARAQLEERMRVLKQSMDGGKKKKKSALNCF